MGDLSLAATPLQLGPFGFGATCVSYLNYPQPVGLAISDAKGTFRFGIGLPNNPAIVGINLAFQCALLDPAVTTPVTYVASNAIVLTIQP
jgi:hypothetical protein